MKGTTWGTEFLIRCEGHLLTCAHVVKAAGGWKNVRILDQPVNRLYEGDPERDDFNSGFCRRAKLSGLFMVRNVVSGFAAMNRQVLSVLVMGLLLLFIFSPFAALGLMFVMLFAASLFWFVAALFQGATSGEER